MVARKELFAAVRSGEFVPFPYSPRFKSIDLASILEETIQALPEYRMAELILYIAGYQETAPTSLTLRERLFYRAMRNGLITVNA